MKLLQSKILICIFLAGNISFLCSQNLVVNGNFSEYLRCPQTYNHYRSNIRTLLPGWFTINKSTPDFFHRCAENKKVGVPENFAGRMESFTGNGYIGLILRADRETYRYSPSYSEHITGTLTEPLLKGNTYRFSLAYALAGNSGIMTNGIGVYFSLEKPVFSDSDDEYSFEPQLILHPDSLLNQSNQWTELSAVFTAGGGEKYLTIGNFLPVSKSIIIKHNPEKHTDTRFFAYYYIDGINLIPCNQEQYEEKTAMIVNPGLPNNFISQEDYNDVLFAPGKSYTLNHVLFDFDKSELRTESYKELNSISEFLTQNPDIHILITGHTDNIGSESFNMKLSEDRAKAVFEYLYKKGISVKRMGFRGMGSTMPVSDNDTEKGRQLNRRVEIEFFTPK